MKSTKKDIYTEVKLETDYPQTLKRMMAQNGYCFNMDVDGADLFFECFKNGRFSIQRYNEKNSTDYYSHYLTGRIIDNGETASVRYRIVQQKTPLVLNLVLSIFIVLIFVFCCFISYVLNGSLDCRLAIMLLILPALIYHRFLASKNLKKHSGESIEIFDDAIRDIINAVERWND